MTSRIAAHALSSYAVYTGESFQLCVMPIDELVSLFAQSESTSDVQRDHVKRAPRFKRVFKELTDELLSFVATYRTDTGELRLEDGFTRMQCYKTKMAACNLPVRLSIHAVNSVEEQRLIYERLNNPDASKKSVHFMEGGFRAEHMLDGFTSSLLQTGARVYAIRKAASGIPVYDATRLLAPALRFLDKKGLTRRWESTGLLAAYLALSRVAEARPLLASAVHEFIDYMSNPAQVFQPSMGLAGRVLALNHKFYTSKYSQRALSGGNADAVLHMALGAFHAIQELKSLGYVRLPRGFAITPMSVVNFNLRYL